MQTIFELKEQAVTDTPLLLFDCVLPGGQSEHWSTHTVTIGDVDYSARVLRHNWCLPMPTPTVRRSSGRSGGRERS